MTRILLALLLLAGSFSSEAATKYVRPDGGTATQCTGSVDAAYPGSGTAQPCAWVHPSWAFGMYGGTSRLSGGDTLIIKNGSYAMGYGAPSNADKTGCSSSSAYNCYMLPPPSGTSTAPTRILGEQHTDCKVKPELWGTDGVKQILHLDNSNWIEVKCLEITDHSRCIDGHYNSSLDCTGTADYARHGIHMWNAQNILWEDLNIHGLGQNCYKGSKIHNFTMRRVRLVACGDAGFHGNVYDGADDSFTGTILLKNVEIAWNGCGEDYPTLRIHGCYAAASNAYGGYGDGLGTSETGGNWIIEDSYIHSNTSDGLDLRYTKLDPSNTFVTIRRSWFYNNAGNQVKVWGKMLMENSYVSSRCDYFGSRYDTISDGITDPTPCRAEGTAIFVIAPNISGVGATLRYNTVTGNGILMFHYHQEAGAGTASVARLENNVFIGQPAWNGSGQSYFTNDGNSTIQYYNNSVYGMRSGTCPSGSSCVSPGLRNQTMAAFDPRPTSTSPILGAGNTSYTTPATDITGKTRPSAPARGAFEYSP